MRKFTHIGRPAWIHTQISIPVNWYRSAKKKKKKSTACIFRYVTTEVQILAPSRLAPSLPTVVFLPRAMQKNDFALLHPSPSLQIIQSLQYQIISRNFSACFNLIAQTATSGGWASFHLVKKRGGEKEWEEEVAQERGMANSSQRSALKASVFHSHGPYVKQRANRLKERRIARKTIYKKGGKYRWCEVWYFRSGALTCVPQHLTCP